MAYEGYLSIGGVEVVNNERARGYSRTAACPMFWLKDDPCASLEDALATISRVEEDETPGTYVAEEITGAPWFDWTQTDLSTRFYGVFATSIKGLYDSTRTATVTEGIDAGGTVGAERRTTRDIRVTVLLLARGRDALEFGSRWLDASLSRQACGRHTSGCGTTDLTYFTACPPRRLLGVIPSEDPEVAPGDEPDADYFPRLDEYRRWLHGVSAISGPTERSEMNVGDFWALEMEFVLNAGRPWVYSSTRAVTLPTTPSTVIDDIPKNLIPYPSAELAGSAVLLAQNLSTNPSVETNATGWSGGADTISGTTVPGALLTNGRVTELAAVGAASFRQRLLGATGTTGSGIADLWASQDVLLGSLAPNSRVSVNIWGALVQVAGGSSTGLVQLRCVLEWRSSTALVASETIVASPGDFGGFAFLFRSRTPPAGADRARVRVYGRVNWQSSATAATNSDLRLYADALAVTIP
uniref:Minor tail protein n=2 Tax=unclassified bacterial viruses TaxID=12333 RepID=A0AAU7J7K2_9VIRU